MVPLLRNAAARALLRVASWATRAASRLSTPAPVTAVGPVWPPVASDPPEHWLAAVADATWMGTSGLGSQSKGYAGPAAVVPAASTAPVRPIVDSSSLNAPRGHARAGDVLVRPSVASIAMPARPAGPIPGAMSASVRPAPVCVIAADPAADPIVADPIVADPIGSAVPSVRAARSLSAPVRIAESETGTRGIGGTVKIDRATTSAAGARRTDATSDDMPSAADRRRSASYSQTSDDSWSARGSRPGHRLGSDRASDLPRSTAADRRVADRSQSGHARPEAVDTWRRAGVSPRPDHIASPGHPAGDATWREGGHRAAVNASTPTWPDLLADDREPVVAKDNSARSARLMAEQEGSTWNA